MQGLGQRQFIDGAHGMRQKGRLDFYHIKKSSLSARTKVKGGAGIFIWSGQSRRNQQKI